MPLDSVHSPKYYWLYLELSSKHQVSNSKAAALQAIPDTRVNGCILVLLTDGFDSKNLEME
jgi:hypothetical protein